MQKQKVHIVVVPASFAPPSLYSDFFQHLSEYGLNATVVDFKSVGNHDPLPAASMMDDAEHIKSVMTKLANDGYDIILMMHSYGGICGPRGTEEVLRSERQAMETPGDFIHLVYASSPVPTSLYLS
jgi:hypothetical protein